MRGHPGSNQGPLDLQSNALPLSYIPTYLTRMFIGHVLYADSVAFCDILCQDKF